MRLQTQLKHWKRRRDAEAWFKRTVDIPSVPALLDEVAQLKADKRRANIISCCLSVLFAILMFWSAQHA